MRVEGWEQNLAAVEAAFRRKPHDWAGNNCAHFADAAIAAVTGSGRLEALRLSVTDEASAAAALASLGFDNLGDCLASLFPEIAPARAMRGDIGIVTRKDSAAIVVVLGAYVAAPSFHSLGLVSRTHLDRAFRVD